MRVFGNDLYVGGRFLGLLQRWDGSRWNLTTYRGSSTVDTLGEFGGELIAAESLSSGFSRFDGDTWSQVLAHGSVRAMTVMGDQLIVGGQSFFYAGTTPLQGVGAWNGATWSGLGHGLNGIVYAVRATPNGDILVGGSFSQAADVPARLVARKSGATWLPLGEGFTTVVPLYWPVLSFAVRGDDDFYAGGGFRSSVDPAIRSVAHWNGTAWESVGAGLPGTVRSIRLQPDDSLLAGGGFFDAGVRTNIQRWTQQQWFGVGSWVEGLSSEVHTITERPGGLFTIGGSFVSSAGTALNNVADWNGSAWTQMSSGMNGAVLATGSLANGDIIAGGSFTTAGGNAANRIARWNGTSWSPLGSGLTNTVNAILVLPNGSVVVGGSFIRAGGQIVNRIAVWNGTSWAPMGRGSAFGFNNQVRDLTLMPNGDIVAGGDFTIAGGNVSAFIARWRPCCPADFNQDTEVNADDLADYVNCFFSPAPFAAECSRVDFDADGLVTPDDLASYVSAFFAGCE